MATIHKFHSGNNTSLPTTGSTPDYVNKSGSTYYYRTQTQGSASSSFDLGTYGGNTFVVEVSSQPTDGNSGPYVFFCIYRSGSNYLGVEITPTSSYTSGTSIFYTFENISAISGYTFRVFRAYDSSSSTTTWYGTQALSITVDPSIWEIVEYDNFYDDGSSKTIPPLLYNQQGLSNLEIKPSFTTRYGNLWEVSPSTQYSFVVNAKNDNLSFRQGSAFPSTSSSSVSTTVVVDPNTNEATYTFTTAASTTYLSVVLVGGEIANLNPKLIGTRTSGWYNARLYESNSNSWS